MTPKAEAGQSIPRLQQQSGWYVCDMAQSNLHASRGLAIREFPFNMGYDVADCLLCISDNISCSQLPVLPTEEHQRIVSEVDRHVSLIRGFNANLKRAVRLRQSLPVDFFLLSKI
jgi:hypothetical protein